MADGCIPALDRLAKRIASMALGSTGKDLYAALGVLNEAYEWWGNVEGVPSNEVEADLMIALWRFHGDQTEACPDCDGDCDEPCAPTTAAAAIANLEHWKEEWRAEKERASQLQLAGVGRVGP